MIRGHSLSARFDDQAKKSANDSSDDDDDDDASDGEVPAGFSKELTAEERAIVGDGKMSEEEKAALEKLKTTTLQTSQVLCRFFMAETCRHSKRKYEPSFERNLLASCRHKRTWSDSPKFAAKERCYSSNHFERAFHATNLSGH